MLGDESERCQLVDQLAVEPRLGREVELLEGLLMREARRAQAPLQSPLLGGLDLGPQEPIEELGVGGLFLLGSLERRRKALRSGGEAQVAD